MNFRDGSDKMMEVVKGRNKESAQFRTRAAFQIEDGKKLHKLSSGDRQTPGESNREIKSKISSGGIDKLKRKWRSATRTISVCIMQDCKYESPPSIGEDLCNKDE